MKKKPWIGFILKRGIIIFIIAALIINAPSFLSIYYKLRYSRAVKELLVMPEITENDRLLVLSPHPDDETLCCSGIIQKAVNKGAEVYIVWLTSGDGFEWDTRVFYRSPKISPKSMMQLGQIRMKEAQISAAILKVPEKNIFFLGYPDKGLFRLFLDYYYEPMESHYTHLRSVNYTGTFSQGASYTGKNIENDLNEIINLVKPTLVLAPSPEDTHQDHKATAYFAMRIFGKRGELNKVRYWIVHGGYEWPLPKGWHTDINLIPSKKGKRHEWMRVDLTEEEINTKIEAIKAHKTQMKVVGRFMAAFAKQNELFSTEPIIITEEEINATEIVDFEADELY